jgi:hypothetical protein
MAGGAVSTGAVAAGPVLSKRERIFAFALVASLFFAWGLSVRTDFSFLVGVTGADSYTTTVLVHRCSQQEGADFLRHHQVEVDDASGRLVSLPSESEQRMCAWLTLELAASAPTSSCRSPRPCLRLASDTARAFCSVSPSTASARSDSGRRRTTRNTQASSPLPLSSPPDSPPSRLWPTRAFHSLFSLLRRALIIDAFIGSAATHLSSVRPKVLPSASTWPSRYVTILRRRVRQAVSRPKSLITSSPAVQWSCHLRWTPDRFPHLLRI